MASLKEVKRRINSVNGTLKITSAMKTVASAKLHKALGVINTLLPYQAQMNEILQKSLAYSPDKTAGAAYKTERPLGKVALMVVSSNSSLCGAFNSNVIKLLTDRVEWYKAQGLANEDILVFPVGNKVTDAAIKRKFNVQGRFSRLADKHIYSETVEFAQMLMEKYLSGEVDKVELIYNKYKNAGSQQSMYETYLPVNLDVAADDAQVDDDYYIFDPQPAEIIEVLLPKALVLKIYAVLLDAGAAEHSARTIAMQEATDNGEDLLQELSIQYNKQRQQAITNELLDIMGGQL